MLVLFCIKHDFVFIKQKNLFYSPLFAYSSLPIIPKLFFRKSFEEI